MTERKEQQGKRWCKSCYCSFAYDNTLCLVQIKGKGQDIFIEDSAFLQKVCCGRAEALTAWTDY